MFFQWTELPDWAEKLLLLLAVPLAGAVIGAVRYVYLQWANREAKKIDLLGKKADVDHKKSAELIDLSAELLKTINVVKELTNENQSLGKIVLENERKNDEAVEIIEEAKEKVERELADHIEYIAEIEKICERETFSFRQLMARLDIPYWEADGSGKSFFINDAWLRMFRVTENNQSEWINTVVQADRLKIAHEWKQRLADTDMTAALEFRITGDQGEAIDVKSVYVIVRNLNGEPLKIRGVTIKI